MADVRTDALPSTVMVSSPYGCRRRPGSSQSDPREILAGQIVLRRQPALGWLKNSIAARNGNAAHRDKKGTGSVMRHTIIFMVLASLLTACAVLAPTPTPTPAPSATPTLEPTLTSTPVPDTPTPHAPMETPTSSGSTGKELACKLLMQSIPNNTHFGRNDQFRIGWKVRNSGTTRWDPGTIVFTYYSGSKLYRYLQTELETSVEAGNVAVLVADMVAPSSSGKYVTVWTLRRGDEDFCHVSLAIIVP